MFRSSFQEERVAKDSKLQAVFSKLTGVLPRAEDLGNNNPKTMSSDIIESVLADSPVPVATNWTTHHDLANNQHISSPVSREPCEEGDHQAAGAAVEALSRRIEAELRAAKRTHLACGEVLLPCGLLQRIASDIVSMAESEPCGLRGCRLYLLFEASAPASSASCASPERRRSIRLGAVHCDPATASTFELYLTLRQSSTGWHFLPQFIRNLTRGGTIVVSPAYTLSKKKLYRSYREE